MMSVMAAALVLLGRWLSKVLVLFALMGNFAFALSVGQQVPDFSAKNQNGKVIRLSQFHGKYVLLYFYPKDGTSGCTTEANQLKEHYAQFQEMNAVILGVSKQDEKSHRQFIEQNSLPFDLIVDSDGKVAKNLGVGLIPILGFHERQSLLIDPQGKILHFYKDVDPAKHAQEVLSDIRKSKSK